MSEPSGDRTQDSPFIKGQRYRVIKRAPSWIGRLVVGELLTYEGSVYDSETKHTIFIFQGVQEQRTWAIHDDEPLNSWSIYFAGCDDAR
jgi:hypothetical protein